MKKIILGAALCGLLAAGCSLDKSYLNGPNALTFPASKAEVEAGVFAAYKGLTLIDASSTPFPRIQDNDIGASRLNAANYNYQQQSKLPTDNAWVEKVYNNIYKTAARANLVLDGIDKVRDLMSEQEYNMYKAELLLTRAYVYEWGCQLYGDIPYIDHVLGLGDSYTRTPRAEVIDKILNEDLKDEMLDFLPLRHNKATYGSTRLGRVGAYGLKARICLNWGCIPTKALLHGAEVAHTITHASQLGISVGEVNVDLQKLVQFSRTVSQQLTAGVAYLLKKNGVRVIDGTARLRGKGQITVEDARGEARDYRADHVILATGARPRALPGIAPDGEHIWTYFEALRPKLLPKSLLIIGSGAIGVEFASLDNDLGCKVTLVELASQILPVEDAEVSAAVRKSFEKRGIQIHTQTLVTQVQLTDIGVRCTLNNTGGEYSQDVERVLLAVGVQPNIEDLGLEALGVELDRGFIKTDAACRTNVFGLYAIGDVARRAWRTRPATKA